MAEKSLGIGGSSLDEVRLTGRGWGSQAGSARCPQADALEALGLSRSRVGVGLAGSAAGKLDGAVLFKLLLGLLGCEQRRPEQPEDKGRDGQKGDCGANFAEM